MARYLALDWDHQQLHVVAATVGGGGVRIQQAAAWQEQQSPNPIEAEALGQLLKERLKSAGIASAPVVVCLGRDRVIVKEVRYPPVLPHEEPAIVRFQAVKELTDPPEEVVIDYVHVSDPRASGERRTFAVIVRREMLQAYRTLCKAAGLKLLGLTPRAFGIAGCVRRLIGTTVLTPAPDVPDAPVAVLTATDRWAEFCVMRGETLLFARSLAVGPGLAGEIRRNLAVYAGQAPQQAPRALYVTGGPEHAALNQRLKELLGIPVHPLDPFAGVEGPELPAINRGAFAGPVGLLYALAEKKDLPINFAHPKEPRPPRDPNVRRFAIAAGVAALALIGTVSFCYATLAEKNSQMETLYLQRKDLDAQLVRLDDEAKRIKALDDWYGSGVVLLDELYDLTDRFPDTNAIRLVQMAIDPLPRATKDKQVAKMSLKGITTEDYHAVDSLIARLVEDGHYRVDPKQLSRNTGLDRFRFPQQFTTRVDIEKRPSDKYVRRLAVAPPEDAERGRGRGRRGGAEMMDFGFGGAMP